MVSDRKGLSACFGWVVLAAIAFGGVGCSSSDTTRTAAPTVPEGAVASAAVVTEDGSTGALLDGVVLTITQGADSTTSTTYTTSAGLATVTLEPSVDPVQSPVALSVKAEKDGYVPTTGRLTLNSAGVTTVTIKLLPRQSGETSDGVAMQVQNDVATADTSGRISTPISVTTPDIASSTGSAGITIPANTVLTAIDENGQDVPVSGSLSATTVYHDATSGSALETFPGGLAVSLEGPVDSVDEPGVQTNEVTFVSAGFTSIEISDENGNVVKNFSQPVTIRMDIPADTWNPRTGATVQVGDVVPIWSFENDSGKWTYEGDGTVQSDASGLYAETQVTHLSYWNLDWHYSATCTGTLTINDINTGSQWRGNARFSAMFSQGSGYLYSGRYNGDGFIRFYNYPQGKKVQLTITDLQSGQEIPVSTFDGGAVPAEGIEMCGNHTIGVNAPVVVPAQLDVEAMTTCENDPAQPGVPVPNTWVYVYSNGRFVSYGYTNADGVAALQGLVSGGDYTVYVYDRVNYRGYAIQQITLGAGDNSLRFDFPQTCEVVNEPTGGTGSSS